jgi:hypothetical protein
MPFKGYIVFSNLQGRDHGCRVSMDFADVQVVVRSLIQSSPSENIFLGEFIEKFRWGGICAMGNVACWLKRAMYNKRISSTVIEFVHTEDGKRVNNKNYEDTLTSYD